MPTDFARIEITLFLFSGISLLCRVLCVDIVKRDDPVVENANRRRCRTSQNFACRLI